MNQVTEGFSLNEVSSTLLVGILVASRADNNIDADKVELFSAVILVFWLCHFWKAPGLVIG